MEVDILIYITTLKKFFDNDQEAYKDMFGTLTIDKDLFFKHITKVAHTNYKETGEAILSTDQLYGVVDELLHKKLIERNEENNLPPSFRKILKDFPPFSLN
jgi:hypothetical protein